MAGRRLGCALSIDQVTHIVESAESFENMKHYIYANICNTFTACVKVHTYLLTYLQHICDGSKYVCENTLEKRLRVYLVGFLNDLGKGRL